MKKITLIAAAVALLMSGGVFMKTNSINETLSENIQAFSEGGGSSGTCGYYINYGSGTEVLCMTSKAIAYECWYRAKYWGGYTSYWCCDSCKNTFYCGY
ncbi:MAG: hypothetical protein J6U04_12845 [Salinivirgaceae bacterium]|nr:hypothetical protein [Salinivirgaceae bacterium]